MKIVETKKAPAVVGPYSQAIKANGLLFCSGQIGIGPKKGKLVKGVEAQTKQIMANLSSVLEAGGSSLDKVVKTTIYLTSIDDYALVNEIYAKYFKISKPARATVAVAKLPARALVEIDCIAIIKM